MAVAAFTRAPFDCGLLAGLGLLGRLGLCALERAAGLREEDVVEAGSVQLEVRDPHVRRVVYADDVGELLAAVVETDGGAVRRPGNELAERLEQLGDPRAFRMVGWDDLDGRPPDLGLERLRVPLATILPWSMIPRWSASRSASRYWVVRKTVTPSSRERRATSSQSAVRLWMSRPVVGSSRKRTRGRSRASARSSRRFIPPE